MKRLIIAVCLLAFARPVVAQTCDVSELIRLERQRLGQEKPRGFPTPTASAPRPAPGLLAPCNLPDKMCNEKLAVEAKVAAFELDLKIRAIVLACERAGY